MYGLSGASGKTPTINKERSIHIICVGRHCCLWCTVTYTNLQEPLAKRGKSSLRTLATLEQDYDSFLTQGKGNINLAKDYNNVIRPPIFSIPLDMVKEIT